MKIKQRIAILADYPTWLIDPSLPEFHGHYAVWLVALSDAFEHQQDYEIHWITLRKDIQTTRHIEAKGQHFHILPRARRMIGLYSGYIYDRGLIKNCISSIKADLVHAWGIEDCYALSGGDFKGKKILSIQGLLKAYLKRGRMDSFAKRHSFYEAHAIRHYQHITTESAWATEQLGEITTNATTYHFEYAVEKRFFKTCRNLSQQASCLFAGTDTPIKNIDSLIEAFSADEMQHIHLYLAGVSTESRPGLPNNITALGRLNREELAAQLAGTWCLVHPSLADTGPTIVKEARVMGIPVILSSQCGSKQHIVEGESGFIIDPMDTKALQQHVLHICESAQRSLEMGAFNQELCRQDLSEARMASRLNELYQKILST